MFKKILKITCQTFLSDLSLEPSQHCLNTLTSPSLLQFFFWLLFFFPLFFPDATIFWPIKMRQILLPHMNCTWKFVSVFSQSVVSVLSFSLPYTLPKLRSQMQLFTSFVTNQLSPLSPRYMTFTLDYILWFSVGLYPLVLNCSISLLINYNLIESKTHVL